MNSLWDILAVAIGISFIFMILSILNSWIQEYIATVFNMRAKNLADIMQNLLEPGSLKLNGYEKAKAPPENLVYEAGSEEKLTEVARKFDVSIQPYGTFSKISSFDVQLGNRDRPAPAELANGGADGSFAVLLAGRASSGTTASEHQPLAAKSYRCAGLSGRHAPAAQPR